MAKTRKSAKNTQKSAQTTGQVRIIAGKWRGRKLSVLNEEGLRPTTDRLKETLFNWLMADVAEANVIDCFAGAGSLGFEALSRGAASCKFIELNKSAAGKLKDNLKLLQADNTQVLCQNALAALDSKGNNHIDIAFVDPPFRKNLAASTCELLENNQHLAEDALIYVEVESELEDFTPPTNWQLLKEKSAGQVSCRLYLRS